MTDTQPYVLDIVSNRCEKWTTADCFLRLRFEEKLHRFLGLLGFCDINEADIKLHLFWHGLRDYRHTRKDSIQTMNSELVSIYLELFSGIRDIVKCNDVFNYNADALQNGSAFKSYLNNIESTEIDIVIETPHHFFVGEAKDESEFGSKSTLFLPHQLVRQYITCRVFLELLNRKENIKKDLIPFIVCSNERRYRQIDYLRKISFKEVPVITWQGIEAIF